MPSLNHTEFPEKVASGEKRCSIRATRKRPFKAGDTLYHFAGQRTKHCRRLMTVPCERASKIRIDICSVFINGVGLEDAEIDELALADGFNSTDDFFEYFIKDCCAEFHGQLIEWEPTEASYLSDKPQVQP